MDLMEQPSFDASEESRPRAFEDLACLSLVHQNFTSYLDSSHNTSPVLG